MIQTTQNVELLTKKKKKKKKKLFMVCEGSTVFKKVSVVKQLTDTEVFISRPQYFILYFISPKTTVV